MIFRKQTVTEGDLVSKTIDQSNTKEKLLLHAADVFLEHSYENTTVRMIAQRAGVNAALINYHYGDKETLYLEVVRYWARDAFQNFPLGFLDDPTADPAEKIRVFIYHALVCLFGPEGKGTGFGRLLVHEAAVRPSTVVQNIVSETIGPPTKAVTAAVAQITGISDVEKLQVYTACIVGQTVYFYLSRNLTKELLDIPAISCSQDIQALSDEIYTFSMASLKYLKEQKGKSET